MNPSLLVLLSGGLLAFWSLCSRGLKRSPFWISFAVGIVLVLLSLNYWVYSRDGWLGQVIRNEVLALAGFVLLILSRLVGGRSTLNGRRFLIITAVITLGATVAGSAFIPGDIRNDELSYDEGRQVLISMLHPGAGNYVEDIDDYVDDILEDETLDPEERAATIRALNDRIQAMESELALFESTREENAAQVAEIEALRSQVDAALKRAADAESRPDGKGQVIVTLNGEEVTRVRGFAAAVEPDAPIVRDFAVVLASKVPGSYYRDDGDKYAAGKNGVKQIIAIHNYISTEWKYVNDPVSIGSDYYSPAHRTIAAGLAGDCDDFSVLVSSAIEAVGGKTRIMGGSCSGGYHAWTEVYIGSKGAFNEAVQIISRTYPGRKVGYMTDIAGGYWLCLDWQLGEYSCGNDAHVLYQRLGGV